MTLVRIPKENLRKGMYIELVECPQFVYGNRRFMLVQDADMAAIMASTAEFVLINTAKGRAEVSPQVGDEAQAAVSDEEEIRLLMAETLTRSTSTLKQSMAGFLSGDIRDVSDLTPVAREMSARMATDAPILLELTRLKTKDEGTFVHSFSVGALMSSVSQAAGMGSDTVEIMAIAGMLHDFGKLLIPNRVLNKPGALSDAERELIREHPQRGYALLKTYPDIPEVVLDICYQHHEMLDGSGYPRGLRGAKISTEVRISTICDVFDALTTIRPYKRPWTPREAIAWMFERDDKFDRKMLLRLGEVVDLAATS